MFRLGALTALTQAGLSGSWLNPEQVVPGVLARHHEVQRTAGDSAGTTVGSALCLVLDSRLGSGRYGVQTVSELTSAVPGLRVVVVIEALGAVGLVEVLEAGARALVHRQCSASELVAAVRSALSGANWVSEQLAGPVRAELLAESSGEPGQALTARERDVLRGLARGRTNAAIGVSLGISEHTVRNHVHAVLRKLSVSNRTDAVATALRRGLVDLAD